MLAIQHNIRNKDKISSVPRLESTSLILEELQPEHARYVFNFASHDQVAKTVVWDAHKTIGDSLAYIEKIKLKLSDKFGSVFLNWGVRSKVDGNIIGLVSLTQLDQHSLQIGYVFHFDRWNSVLPIESLNAAIYYAFCSFPDLERIHGRCFPSSIYSIALMEKLGMQYQEEVYTVLKVRGRDRELANYSLPRSHWNTIKKI